MSRTRSSSRCISACLDSRSFGVGVGRDVDRRGEEDYGASERGGQQEVVPGFFEGLAAITPMWKTRTGQPVFLASITGPGLAT